MSKKLKNIVDIRTGYGFRGKVVADPHGDIDVIQIKDITELHELDVDNLTTVKLKRAEKYLIHPGEVLFLSRGDRRIAMVVPELHRKTVASGYFFILRPIENNVLPGYLAWYLNMPLFQHRLRSLLLGMHMQLIAKSNFADLEIELPDLQTQQQIAQLNELQKREAKLMNQIQAKRAQLIQAITQNLLSESTNKKDH